MKASNDTGQQPKMPVVYLPHGGGPFSYVDMGLPKAEVESLAKHWQEVGRSTPMKPQAVLVISAHWEETLPTVMSAAKPAMYYDYYGFPPASYEIQWPAPGAPGLAQRVQTLLKAGGFESASDPERGFDHGTFVPMGRGFPKADVPTLQLSLKKGLDPAEHIAMGRALAPLRDEGVLIVGSGMSYHNMRGFRDPGANQAALRFDAWLQGAVRQPQAERDGALIAWESAPDARDVHPREEHLLPLMVVAGAAMADRGAVPWTGPVFGKVVSSIRFG